MCSILASSCVQGPWAGARMFEMLAAQDMGACFWLVELFRDGGEETKKRPGSRSTRLRFELCTSACETYMMQFLLKIFRSVLNLLSAELPDSRGIFVRLESQTVWLKNDDWICTWSRKLHDRPRVHSTSHPADERDTPVQSLDTTHFYCPPVTLKWKSDDLFFAWSRKLHDYGARGPRLGAHSVWQPADERVTAISKTGHINTFIAPFWCAVPWICHEW